MYIQALAQFEKTFGPEDSTTIVVVNNFGVLYSKLDRLDESEQMYKRALVGREKLGGRDHLRTLDTVDSLGELYGYLGRLDEAEEMFTRTVAGFEKLFGKEHPRFIQATYALAEVYRDQGRLEEAENLLAPSHRPRVEGSLPAALRSEHRLTLQVPSHEDPRREGRWNVFTIMPRRGQ